jgi:biopolymer transport protein TolR
MGIGTGGSGGGRKKPISDINVTPLVDVMLVLLIIFMVSTPLIVKDESERVVDLNLPVTADNPNQVDISNTDKLILAIGPNLRVSLGDEIITDCSATIAIEDPALWPAAWAPCFDEIQTKLGNNPRLAEQESLYLLADTTIPYGFAVGALNRIRMAGVTNVGMVTNPELNVAAAPTPEDDPTE